MQHVLTFCDTLHPVGVESVTDRQRAINNRSYKVYETTPNKYRRKKRTLAGALLLIDAATNT